VAELVKIFVLESLHADGTGTGQVTQLIIDEEALRRRNI
jgi:hypothetical protein